MPEEHRNTLREIAEAWLARAPGRRRAKPPPLTEADLQARLDAARMRLHEIVILSMKTWLPEETRQGLGQAEAFRREQVRAHFRALSTVERPVAPGV